MRKLIIYLLALFLISCTQKEQEKTSAKIYFDVKGYFEKEAKRLDNNKALVHKSVAINGITEQKTIHIPDFKNELGSFISSDINKASWRGSFNVKKDKDLTVYTTTEEKIPVKKIEVRMQNDKPVYIKILVVNTNILYTSSDTLAYFPDSLYEIKKTQKIKLLKEKKYAVIGKFISN
jgi:hypothetical protein